MGQGSEFRGLSQSVVGKEMRMRIEHSFRSFGCEGEGGVGGGGGGKEGHGVQAPRRHSFLPPDKQNGKEIIRRSLGPSPSNLLKYLAAFVYKKEFTDIYVSIYSQNNKIIIPSPPPNPRVPITMLLPIPFWPPKHPLSWILCLSLPCFKNIYSTLNVSLNNILFALLAFELCENSVIRCVDRVTFFPCMFMGITGAVWFPLLQSPLWVCTVCSSVLLPVNTRVVSSPLSKTVTGK